MTTAQTVRHDARVTKETRWQRLHRIALARLERLELTQTGLRNAGGPSRAWFSAMRDFEGPVSNHQELTLARLDAALKWPAGTSWGLVAEDRSRWSSELLDDEEDGLVKRDDDISHFAFMVEQRLRALPEDEVRPAMEGIAWALGLPVARPGD